MLLHLTLPFVHAQLDRLVVDHWHVEEGQGVAFGDDLCDLTAESYRSQPRRVSPNLFLDPNAGPAPPSAIRIERVDILVRLTAADDGIVRRILCRPGTPVGVADLLALLTTDPDEPVQSDGAERRGGFRSVANFVEAEEPT